MYGISDAIREDQENLHKLDNMVTTSKKALEKIIELSGDSENLGMIKATAAIALLEIERKGLGVR